MKKTISYLVWIDEKSNEKIEMVFEKYFILVSMRESKYKIMGKNGLLRGFLKDELIKKIDKNLFIVRTNPYWSPGDLAGFLKNVTVPYCGEYISNDDEKILSLSANVIAFPINGEMYIPDQGLSVASKYLLSDWISEFDLIEEEL